MLEVKGQGDTLGQVCCSGGDIYINAGASESSF